MIIKCYKDNEEILNEELDGRGIYNTIPVMLAEKYNLIKLDSSYYLNDINALEKRLDAKLDTATLEKLKALSLTSEEEYALEIVEAPIFKEDDVDGFLMFARSFSFGSFEDISSLLEDNEIDGFSCDCLEIIK